MCFPISAITSFRSFSPLAVREVAGFVAAVKGFLVLVFAGLVFVAVCMLQVFAGCVGSAGKRSRCGTAASPA